MTTNGVEGGTSTSAIICFETALKLLKVDLEAEEAQLDKSAAMEWP